MAFQYLINTTRKISTRARKVILFLRKSITLNEGIVAKMGVSIVRMGLIKRKGELGVNYKLKNRY